MNDFLSRVEAILSGVMNFNPKSRVERLLMKWVGSVGNVEDLETYDKSSLVAAINEVAESGGGGGLPEAPKDGETYGRKDGSWNNLSNIYAQKSDLKDLDDRVTYLEEHGSGGGLTQAEKNNLLTILDAVIVETEKQDAANAALEALRILWQGGQIIVTQEGSTLVFVGVDPITTIAQSGSTLIMT